MVHSGAALGFITVPENETDTETRTYDVRCRAHLRLLLNQTGHRQGDSHANMQRYRHTSVVRHICVIEWTPLITIDKTLGNKNPTCKKMPWTEILARLARLPSVSSLPNISPPWCFTFQGDKSRPAGTCWMYRPFKLGWRWLFCT